MNPDLSERQVCALERIADALGDISKRFEADAREFSAMVQACTNLVIEDHPLRALRILPVEL